MVLPYLHKIWKSSGWGWGGENSREVGAQQGGRGKSREVGDTKSLTNLGGKKAARWEQLYRGKKDCE